MTKYNYITVRQGFELERDNIKEWRKGLYRLDRNHKGYWIPVQWKKKLFNVARVDKKDIFISWLHAGLEANKRNSNEDMARLMGIKPSKAGAILRTALEIYYIRLSKLIFSDNSGDHTDGLQKLIY